MMRALRLVPLALLLTACPASKLKPGQPVLVPAVPYLTKQTDVITVPRQEFVNTWAATQVLYRELMKQAEGACAIGAWPKTACARLPDVRDEAKLLYVRVEARIRNPEAEIDWENVATLVGVLSKVVVP